MNWSKQLPKNAPWVRPQPGAGLWASLIEKGRLAVRTSVQLLRLASAGARGIGLPAWRAGLRHQAVQDLCLMVEHRARLLAAQDDPLECLYENPVELGVVLAQTDRRQSGQRVLRRLHLCKRRGAHLQPGITIQRQLRVHDR